MNISEWKPSFWVQRKLVKFSYFGKFKISVLGIIPFSLALNRVYLSWWDHITFTCCKMLDFWKMAHLGWHIFSRKAWHSNFITRVKLRFHFISQDFWFCFSPLPFALPLSIQTLLGWGKEFWSHYRNPDICIKAYWKESYLKVKWSLVFNP